jgi:hypothetical protein
MFTPLEEDVVLLEATFSSSRRKVPVLYLIARKKPLLLTHCRLAI